MSKALDRFYEDYAKLEKLEKQVVQNLREREAVVGRGEPAGKYDYMLKSGLDNMRFDLKNIEKLAYLYQNDPAKYSEISSKEKDKRIKKITEIKNRAEQLGIQIRVSVEGSGSTPSAITQTKMAPTNTDDLEAKPLVQRGNDGEYEETRGQNNKQVLSKQKNMLKDQDQHLDQIGGIISNIKYDNQNFNQEVTYQNRMLGKLNTDMDRTNNKMVKVDSRLKELIAKSNQWCLWLIILIEIVVLILVIVI